MCGRYSIGEEFSELRLNGQLVEFPPFAPRYNVAPSANGGFEVPIVRLGPQGEPLGTLARFWLIPSWWKRPLSALPTSFNARSEELEQKPMFREPFRRHRCLVPATGWREFQGAPGHKRAFQFHEDGWFTFAGLCDTQLTLHGELVESFAIVTAEANAAVRPYHDRMPVVMPEPMRERWLTDAAARQTTLDAAVRAQATSLRVYEASQFGNSVRNEGKACIAPLVGQQELF